jgi:thiopeptide-type bacteriocin biosynthesis protein
MRAERRAHDFHFLRKSPGIRLRLRAGRRDGTADRMKAVLDGLRRKERIARWFRSAYEPETFQFGGARATQAVHAYFSADSLAWWRWQVLQARGQPRIAPTVLSLAALNSLFHGLVGGIPEEVWDIWCRLAALHGERPSDGDPRVPAVTPDALIGHVTADEWAVIQAYVRANDRLCRRLTRLWSAGRMLYSFRGILAHVALFHWNRFGFTPQERRRMLAAMTSAWFPKHQPSPRLDVRAAEERRDDPV